MMRTNERPHFKIFDQSSDSTQELDIQHEEVLPPAYVEAVGTHGQENVAPTPEEEFFQAIQGAVEAVRAELNPPPAPTAPPAQPAAVEDAAVDPDVQEPADEGQGRSDRRAGLRPANQIKKPERLIEEE